MPLRRLRGDVDTLFQRSSSTATLRAELVSLTVRLKAAEAALRHERELRTRLETMPTTTPSPGPR